MARHIHSVPHSFNLVVNPGRAVPITANPTEVEVAIVVASIANGGIIYIGGQECDPNTGIELDGGRGFLFAATSSFGYQEMMQSALGTGLRMNTLGSFPPGETINALIPLNQIFVTASAVTQNLRVLYMLPVMV